MPHIDPKAAVFQRARVASGPGVHADEVDSALADIASKLTAGTRRALAEEAAPDGDDGPLETVGNPPEGDEGVGAAGDGPDDDVLVRVADLLPITKLLTGQWGPDSTSAPRAMDVRTNPPEDAPRERRDYTPFFDRMERCRDALADLRDATEARYDEQRGAQIAAAETALAGRLRAAERAEVGRRLASLRGRKPRPWLDAFDMAIAGVEFVLAQRHKVRRSILSALAKDGGLPLGLRWSIIAAKGNKKLPFAAYSEAPMVTCPGAGVCGVPLDEDARRRLRRRGLAWCYSFRAYRYPDAFRRLFLNTLCNYADREFAILRGGGPSAPPARATRDELLAFEDERASAALRGRGGPDEGRYGRVWMEWVKCLVMAKTASIRRGSSSRWGKKPPRIAFFRLFVDGDVGKVDCLLEWMEAIRAMSEEGADLAAERVSKPQTRPVRAYGYSKCWPEFVAADKHYRRTGGAWPSNYALNLSSGSIYHGGSKTSAAGSVREAVEGLPITRGYFEAIPLDRFLVKLEEATHRRRRHLPVVGQGEVDFAFSKGRVRDFADLNRVRTLADLSALWTRWGVSGGPPLTILVEGPLFRAAVERERGLPSLPRVRIETYGPASILRRSVEQQVRSYAYGEYLSRLLRDDHAFGATVRRELARDANYDSEAEYLAAMRKRSRRRADASLTAGGDEGAAFAKKALLDKALAMALHEVLSALSLGGSCPLVCGNCSDAPADAPEGGPEPMHRCASERAFLGQVISIGQH